MTNEKVTKVIDIDKEFVKEYVREHIETKAWVVEEVQKYKEIKGKQYFASFRTVFAHKYLPELFSTKKKEKPSFLDELLAIE